MSIFHTNRLPNVKSLISISINRRFVTKGFLNFYTFLCSCIWPMVNSAPSMLTSCKFLLLLCNFFKFSRFFCIKIWNFFTNNCIIYLIAPMAYLRNVSADAVPNRAPDFTCVRLDSVGLEKEKERSHHETRHYVSNDPGRRTRQPTA